MKNVLTNKTTSGLASLLVDGEENNSGQTLPVKIVLTDECGDTLWDDVLKQDENNLCVKCNEKNQQPVIDKNKIK